MDQIVNDPEFYYEDGDCFIQVEITMFRVRVSLTAIGTALLGTQITS